MVVGGLAHRDIAQQPISEGTVRNHVSAIIAQLGVSDRTQAAAILAVRQRGLVAHNDAQRRSEDVALFRWRQLQVCVALFSVLAIAAGSLSRPE